jgi:hypothetical protein
MKSTSRESEREEGVARWVIVVVLDTMAVQSPGEARPRGVLPLH